MPVGSGYDGFCSSCESHSLSGYCVHPLCKQYSPSFSVCLGSIFSVCVKYPGGGIHPVKDNNVPASLAANLAVMESQCDLHLEKCCGLLHISDIAM